MDVTAKRRNLSRIPPGQYVTSGFPVLSAGPTPRVALDQWSFVIRGELDEPRSWSWEELRALPREDITVDIHCVTKWSKLDTDWSGVSIDTLLAASTRAPSYLLAFCDGGYITNLPLADVTAARPGWRSATTAQPLAARARRAGPAAGAAPVLLEERQVGARAASIVAGRRARFLGMARLPQLW